MRIKIAIFLLPSIFLAVFATAKSADVLSVRQNNLSATEFKSNGDNSPVRSDHWNAQALAGGLPSSRVFHVLAGAESLLSLPIDLSVAQEQSGLLALGCAFWLLGFLWLKKSRRAQQPAADRPLTERPALPSWKPAQAQTSLVITNSPDELPTILVPAGGSSNSLWTAPAMPLNQAHTEVERTAAVGD